jgi:glycosyltransferase involved in cell wall biosynthesis
MRVLHVGTGNMFGGIEVVIANIARNRERSEGIDHRFALGFDAKLAAELRGQGADVGIYGPAQFSKPWTIWNARRKFQQLLVRDRPDVVICHGAWAHAVCGESVKRAGMFLVYWQHDMIPEGAVQGVGWVAGLKRRTFRFERIAAKTLPSVVIANSQITAGTTAEIFPNVAVEVIYCPVELGAQTAIPASSRSEIRSDLQTPEDAVVIVMCCRLEAYKGHSLLLSALAMLKDDQRWVAWIVGGVQRPSDQSYFDGLVESAKLAGIADRVRFLGQRSDVPKLLAAADIHCQPNIDAEPFGIAFVEAMNASLPVVTTRLGGAIEVVGDECGILVPPGDSQALAETLERLIDDPSLRRALGTAGPARAYQLCDPEQILGRLEAVLDAMKSRCGSPEPSPV